MPFTPGERIRWIPRHTDPESTVFVLYDKDDTVLLRLSVGNGGLERARKGALHPVFTAPSSPGTYRYEWVVEGERREHGHLRVQGDTRRQTHKAQRPEPPTRWT